MTGLKDLVTSFFGHVIGLKEPLVGACDSFVGS